MHELILKALRQLEKEHGCTVLFAAESGSRAWGFASPDSDYDVRAIYVKPEAWYWDIAEKKRDTFEAMLPGDLDISAWELRKVLQAFAKGNVTVNEWVGSPIRYMAHEPFRQQLQALLPMYFNPIRATHHYLALSHHAWTTQNARREITLKKLFYALRGLFCAMWSVQFKTMPPTRFDDLLLPTLLPAEILQEVERLKALKQAGCEAATTILAPHVVDFYEHRVRRVNAWVRTLQFTTPSTTPLGNLLQSMVHACNATESLIEH